LPALGEVILVDRVLVAKVEAVAEGVDVVDDSSVPVGGDKTVVCNTTTVDRAVVCRVVLRVVVLVPGGAVNVAVGNVPVGRMLVDDVRTGASVGLGTSIVMVTGAMVTVAVTIGLSVDETKVPELIDTVEV
jgi:hypothetical protein